MLSLEEAKKLGLSDAEPEVPLAVISIYSESVKLHLPKEKKIVWLEPIEFLKKINQVRIPIITTQIDVVYGNYIGKVFPSKRMTLRFKDKDLPVKKRMKIPPVLLLGNPNGTYYIFFLKEEYLSQDTILYRSNLPNVNGNNTICFGNVTNQVPKARTAQDLVDAYEIFFKNTYFTGSPPKRIKLEKIGKLPEVLETLK